MADLVTVYRTIPTAVSAVVGHLESRNLHPVVLDETEATSAYRRHARQVRIAVPQTEEEPAVHILRQWEQRNEQCLRPIVRATNEIVLLLIGALAFLAFVALLDSRGWWFLGLSILLSAIAAVALVRLAWSKTPKR